MQAKPVTTLVKRSSHTTTIIEVEERPLVPLTYPDKVTAKWVWEHVPISTTCTLVGLIFGAGMGFQKLIG